MQKKSLETILYSSAGIVVMLVILIAVNVITGALPVRVDLTQEKAYTLSAGTKAILQKLDTPVKIRFYCTQSETATPETVYLKDYARKVEDLLHEYKQIAGKNLVIEKYDPQPDSDAEDSARLDGLEPQQLSGGDNFYLGLCRQPGRRARGDSVPRAEPRATAGIRHHARHRAGVDAGKTDRRRDERAAGVRRPTNPMMMQMGQQRHAGVDDHRAVETGFQRQAHRDGRGQN